MSEKKTGLGPLPSNLLRPTTPPPDDKDKGQGGAVDSAPVPPAPAPVPVSAPATEGEGKAVPKPRRKRQPLATEDTKGFKLYLPEDIHDRLRLYAMKKRKRVSMAAAELLDKVLPRYRIEEED